MGKLSSIIGNNGYMLSYIYRLCPGHIFTTLFLSLLASLLPVFRLMINRYIINSIQKGQDKNTFFIALSLILFLMIVNILCVGISNYMQQMVIPKNIQIISRKMQSELFDKASKIEMKHFDDPSFFNIYSMALQQSDARAQSVLETFDRFIANLFSVGALVTLISAMEPVLFVLVLIDVLISFLLSTAIIKLQYRFAQERLQPERKMEYAGFLFYRLENAKELRIHRNLKNLLMDKIFHASDAVIHLVHTYGRKIFLYSSTQSVENDFMASAALVYLLQGVLSKRLLIGDFVTLSSSSQQLSAQILELIGSFPEMYEHSLYIDNFKAFLSYELPHNYQEGLPITKIHSVELEKVSFSYPFKEKETLKNIDMTLKTGEVIAIVGANGTGKSTLVKLLTGLYQVGEGQILINGKDISAYELTAFRNCIGIVFQDYKAYALPIAENVLMKQIEKENCEEEEKLVIEALKFAGLYEKVRQLPKGIYTEVTREFNEEGVVFSGGELQKLALARAYIQNSSLLILDEPSSALDPVAEYEMLEKMMSLSKKRCVVIISHRLQNIKTADRIYVLSEGQIAEQGTHEKLMENQGLYYRMYNKQTHEIGKAGS